MNIRTKVYIAYGVLTSLMLAMAGTSAVGFNNLGRTIKDNLEERRVTVEAATGLLESLERQDSATLALIIASGDADQRKSLETAEVNFRKRLKTVGKYADDEEKALIEKVRSHYDAYEQARNEFLAPGEAEGLAHYQAEVFPLFWNVRAEVFRLLSLNFGSFIRADRQVQEAAIDNGIYLGIFITLTLLGLLVISVGMRKHLLGPLRDLAEFTESLSRTPSRRRLPPGGRDELGHLMRNLNEILDNRDSLAAQAEGRTSRHRQIILGLLRHLGEAAVVGMDGRILAASMSSEDESAIEAVVPDLISRMKSLDGPKTALEHRCGPGRMVRMELLTTDGRIPAGWIARLQRTS